MAKARGTLEFDARQRAYGGHARVEGPAGGTLIVPLRHGTKAIGLLAAVAPTVDLGALDAVAGVVAIAIERTQFLSEREAADLVRQKADLAATLLASLSHDLKTPITAIRVAVENLRRALEPPEREEQDMARIDAAAIHFETQWVTPADVVDAAAAQVHHTLSGHALRVDADEQTEIEIDPRVASVALSHLLENAAQYSPPDLAILVEAGVQLDGLHVTVTDQGRARIRIG